MSIIRIQRYSIFFFLKKAYIKITYNSISQSNMNRLPRIKVIKIQFKIIQAGFTVATHNINIHW